ncbi:unnamed protein product [Notodromas monacha]|uniref:Migration and invasion enhancer 1 n=1 Tax=Notodromas monacha TaxID=399045 RepID=A0A7R9BLH4_9CRUS|nr:unnamed protein product [Notodromas monacha]CAG0916205.1 unnamed protein product [Notodromas monacha]
MPVVVDVEYCGPCGYQGIFEDLASIIESNIPNVAVHGNPEGRARSFEVKINDTLVFSRLISNAFPDPNEIAEIAAASCVGVTPTWATHMMS